MSLSKTASRLRRLCSIVVISTFFSSSVSPSFVQASSFNVNQLPLPGSLLLSSSTFVPAHFKGITVSADNPFHFEFVVDNGDSGLTGEALKVESEKLVKYFLASLAVPEDQMWVNLSPYEKDRIIPDSFGKTDMGRDLLAQDYILKQLTASLMNPEGEIGKKFWDDVYLKAAEKGMTQIPVDTFNKVWIVPADASIFETGASAFIANAHLKVMLEQDYVAEQKGRGVDSFGLDSRKDSSMSAEAADVVRSVIIPELEREVNEGAHFAPLRQVYNAMLLATWYKTALKNSLLGQVYVDQNKLKGIDTASKNDQEVIYNKYVEAFKQGAFNAITEGYDPSTGDIVARQYFSGGAEGYRAKNILRRPGAQDLASLASRADGALFNLDVDASTGDGNVSKAMLKSSVEGVIGSYNVQYWLDMQTKIRTLVGKYFSGPEADYLKGLTEPEKVMDTWQTVNLMNAVGEEVPVTIFVGRSQNNTAIGPAKGGFRWITPSEMQKDNSFTQALSELNTIEDVKEEDVRALVYKYLKGTANALSLGMTLKVSGANLPLGGGKGDAFFGLIVEEDNKWVIKDFTNWKTEENKARIARAHSKFVSENNLIGIDVDVPAPDVNTAGTMQWYQDEYLKYLIAQAENEPRYVDQLGGKDIYTLLKNEAERYKDNYPIVQTPLLDLAVKIFNGGFHNGKIQAIPALGTFTGKDLNDGGAQGRTEATGYGVIDAVEVYLESRQDSIAGKTIAVQGSGNVGSYVAIRAQQKGAKVVAISNIKMTLYKEEGFTQNDLKLIFSEEYKGNLQSVFDSQRIKNAESKDVSDVLFLNVDVLIPAAKENVLTGENISQVKAKLIAEGANGPVSAEAEEEFYKNGGVILNDTWVNSAGVTVSYYEMIQAILGVKFTFDQVDFLRRYFIEEAFKKIQVILEEYRNDNLTIRQAYMIASMKRIYEYSQKERGNRLQMLREEGQKLIGLLKDKNLWETSDGNKAMLVNLNEHLQMPATVQKTSGKLPAVTIDLMEKYYGEEGSGKIINPRSVELMSYLAKEYTGKYYELMLKRSERLAAIERGEVFPGGQGDVEMDDVVYDAYGESETVREIIKGDWKVDEIPEPLTRAGAILTGPWEPKMAISALSGREITAADRQLYDAVLNGLQDGLPENFIKVLDKVDLKKPDGSLATQEEKIAYVQAKLKSIQTKLVATDKVVPVRVFADLQDAKIVHGDGSLEGAQTIANVVNGLQKDVVRGRDGKVYSVPPKAEWPVITVRIDDMDVTDRFFTYDGQPIASVITSMTFAIESVAQALDDNPNQSFSLVFPKVETPEEMVLLLNIKKDIEVAAGITKSIPVIFMNETSEAAVKLPLILWAARKDVKITNVGRWDKGASDERIFWFWLKKVYGDLAKIDMFQPLMDFYVRHNLVTAKKHGLLPEGGMVTAMPSEGNAYPEDDQKVIQNIVLDKMYEWLLGYDFAWVASPSYLPLVQTIFQGSREYEAVIEEVDHQTAVKKLLEFPEVPLTMEGIDTAIYELATYFFGYRNTGAAIAIDSLTNKTRGMFDGATLLKNYYFLWMTQNAKKTLETGEVVTEELLNQRFELVMNKMGDRFREFVLQSELDISKIQFNALMGSKNLIFYAKELMNSVVDERDPKVVQKKVDEWVKSYNAQQDMIFGSNKKNGHMPSDHRLKSGDQAMLQDLPAHPTLFERASFIQKGRDFVRKVLGRYVAYPHTAYQIASTTAPFENDLKVTRYAAIKYALEQKFNFRTGTTSKTYGVTNQVEAEAVARSGRIMNVKITDQHLAEILGLKASRAKIKELRQDLKKNGYLDSKNKATKEFIDLDPKDMKLDGDYGLRNAEIFSGLRRVIWGRVKSIYQGGWAAIMKYFGASDQAKEPFTYLSKQVEEMSTLLISHARHQEAAISQMGLNEEEERLYRASPKYIDFYIPIMMDIDHGHERPQQLIQMNLTVGRDGLLVAVVHLEDQSKKKCGHMPRKSLVTTKDWLETMSAVRQQLDAMGLYEVGIVYRTDAEDAHIITGDDDGRDQEFLYGLTNYLNAETLAKARKDAEVEIRKTVAKQVEAGKILAAVEEEEIAKSLAVANKIIDSMIDENGRLKKYHQVITQAESLGVEDEALATIDAVWKKLSGRKTLDQTIEDELLAQGKSAKMTVDEWRAFLQTIPRKYETDFIGIVKAKAEELGIVVHTKDEWDVLAKRSPQIFEDGKTHIMWDHNAAVTHSDGNHFWMIQSGIPMAIARNSYAMHLGDNPWMEQKKANILEIMVWAMALDQRAVDLLIEQNYWELFGKEYDQKFIDQNVEKIVQLLRDYLIQRNYTPEDAFLKTREALVKLGVSVDVAVDLIQSVSRPKANNTSPSFRWPFAKVGVKKEELQHVIDDILKFQPSFKYVATKAEDFQDIWVKTHKSLGLKSEPVLDVDRKMTDKERKNFLSVQGRFSQKQFSTYFGEVKNHVLSQLFVEGIKGQKAEKKAREVLLQVFENGFIADEMYVVSKLQELGYAIENAFTENSQVFAGVVYDTVREEVGKGGKVLFKAYGGASDTQGQKVADLKVNNAMLNTPGGINLNPSSTNLKIERDPNGKPLPAMEQPIFNMKIEGLIPINIQIKPMTVGAYHVMLGLADTNKTDKKSADALFRDSIKARETEELSLLN